METIKVRKWCSSFVLLFGLFPEIWARGPEDLEQNAAVQRFRAYLRIPTVQPDVEYAPAIEFLFGQAKEVGLPTRIFEFVPKKPILLMTWKGSSKEKLLSVILNSHMDVVPVEEDKWMYPPFEAHMDEKKNIFARGSQDMKVMGMMYLEAVRVLKVRGWAPLRDIHVLWVPDEEMGGNDGWGKFSVSKEFEDLNAGIVLDEGCISYNNTYIVNNGEKASWWLVIQALWATGHGAVYFDNSASENMFKSIASINSFRDSQMDLVRAGLKSLEEVVVVNSVFLNSGSPTPDGFTMNIQPSIVEAGFDVRVPPTLEMGAIMNTGIETKDGDVPVATADDSNPWWYLLRIAVSKFNATISRQISNGASDAGFVRRQGVSALGITAIQNVPLGVHSHDDLMNGFEFLKGIKVTEEIIGVYGSFSGSLQSQQMLSENPSLENANVNAAVKVELRSSGVCVRRARSVVLVCTLYLWVSLSPALFPRMVSQ